MEKYSQSGLDGALGEEGTPLLVKGALHLLIGAHSESALFKFEKDALEDCLHAWWRAHSKKGSFLLTVISKYKKGPSLDH